MKKNNYTLYGLFDLLEPNMNYEQVKHFINYMANLKITEDRMERKVKYIPVIIGRRQGRLAFGDMSEEDFDDPFVCENKLYLPENIITDAISGHHMGRLMSYTGHELEHIYQVYRNINDKHSYSDYQTFEFNDEFKEELVKHLGVENFKFIEYFTQQVNFLTGVKLYAESKIEFQANAMATIYYGYNLYKYAKNEPDPVRREFLFDQVKEILEEQCIMNELNNINGKNVQHHIDETLYVGFMDVLKLGYDSKTYKLLVKELYSMGKIIGLDKDFLKTFRHLSHEKYGKIHISQRGKFENMENANQQIDEYTKKVILGTQTKIASHMGEPAVRWQQTLDEEAEIRISEKVEEIFAELE